MGVKQLPHFADEDGGVRRVFRLPENASQIGDVNQLLLTKIHTRMDHSLDRARFASFDMSPRFRDFPGIDLTIYENGHIKVHWRPRIQLA